METDSVKVCPRCGVIRAERCECGHCFTAQAEQESGVAPVSRAKRVASTVLWTVLYTAAFLAPTVAVLWKNKEDWTYWTGWNGVFLLFLAPLNQLFLPTGVLGILDIEKHWLLGIVALTASAATYLILAVQGIRKRSWVLFVLLLVMQAILLYGRFQLRLAE